MASKNPRPLKVAYDIYRLTAGGANGGIKVHHYEFLRCFVEQHSHELQLHVFCQEEILPELDFLGCNGNHQIHVIGSRGSYEPRDSDGSLPPLHYWPQLPDNLLKLLEIDVLYAGFGFSRLYTPDVPQVSLIVDVLHRAYPESLPPEEVVFRDEWYTREIARSTLIQTNSQFCKQQLVDEFGADPDKIFTISLPLHGRFNRVEMGQLPEQLRGLEHKYFLYPANYWPHKNHKRLIEAYALYEKATGENALHLVLTGHPNKGGKKMSALISELGLKNRVHQIGHLDLANYKTVWELSHSLIFPSKYEGFGIPLIEALYFQKPIACSESSYAEEFVSPEATTFKTMRTKDISDALTALQTNPGTFVDQNSTLEKFENENIAATLLAQCLNAANLNGKTPAIVA
ncbi:glycosyl transferase, group 1 family protein [Verrucomicrobiia bacterium DG1235]|nr:glycosyl transferase, group 1 family protein [Verrucomicrobiae bacterium DG1235]